MLNMFPLKPWKPVFWFEFMLLNGLLTCWVLDDEKSNEGGAEVVWLPKSLKGPDELLWSLPKLDDTDGSLFEVPVAAGGCEKLWDCPKVNPFVGPAENEGVAVTFELIEPKGLADGCERPTLGEPTLVVLRSLAALILEDIVSSD